jgi:hypothetical protein
MLNKHFTADRIFPPESFGIKTHTIESFPRTKRRSGCSPLFMCNNNEKFLSPLLAFLLADIGRCLSMWNMKKGKKCIMDFFLWMKFSFYFLCWKFERRKMNLIRLKIDHPLGNVILCSTFFYHEYLRGFCCWGDFQEYSLNFSGIRWERLHSI